jgi:chromosome segregation ATPase
MRLYDIRGEIRALLDSTDDGELTPENLARLDELNLSLDNKIDNCCALLREWESTIAARQAEIDRLKMGIETHKNNVARLKEYMRDNLAQLDIKKHETALFTVRRQASPPAAKCQIDPVELDFMYRRTTITPDNAAAIDHWKQTGQAPEGFVITVSEHIRIS